MPESEAAYLHDLVILLIDGARKAADGRRSAKAAGDRGQVDFENGKVMAYYEVITLLQAQAEVFGFSPSWKGLDALDAFDADRELLLG